MKLVSYQRIHHVSFFDTPPWFTASSLKIGGIHQVSVSQNHKTQNIQEKTYQKTYQKTKTKTYQVIAIG